MTTPSFTNIFKLYYTMYRMEAQIPTSTDDEWTIAVVLANEAVARWATYDNTYWKTLFDTNQNDGSGDQTVVSGQTAYAAPDNFKEAGGFIKIKDSTGGSIRNIPILDPQDAQFKSDLSSYAYFTGDVGNGFNLNLNPTPDTAIVGKQIDYVYYRLPAELANAGDVTECPNAEYIAHRMLAMRFRGSRNPFVDDARNDAEDALRIMKMDNDSGSWANPWSVPDRSGAQFGSGISGGSFF